jgi:putative acetyltransferase
MTTPCIRPIQPEDNAAMASIIRAVMTEFGASGEGYSIHDPEVDAMFDAYQHDRHAYYVLEIGQQVVGGGGIAPLKGADASICELQKLYILPEARGKGLGQQLLATCIAFVESAGYSGIYLESTSRMIQAGKLYLQAGFSTIPSAMGKTGHDKCDRFYYKAFKAA